MPLLPLLLLLRYYHYFAAKIIEDMKIISPLMLLLPMLAL